MLKVEDIEWKSAGEPKDRVFSSGWLYPQEADDILFQLERKGIDANFMEMFGRVNISLHNFSEHRLYDPQKAEAFFRAFPGAKVKDLFHRRPEITEIQEPEYLHEDETQGKETDAGLIADAVPPLSESVRDFLASFDATPESIRRRRAAELRSGKGDLSELIGHEIEGEEGIYLGRYAPRDAAGNSLKRTFNVFAAPEDLADEAGNTYFEYPEAMARLSALRGWHGHDGMNYANDMEILRDLQRGNCPDGWIIPPIELISGSNANTDSLFAHKEKGALKNLSASYRSKLRSDWYMSSTEKTGGPKAQIKFFSLVQGYGTEEQQDFGIARCRPVRLVPVTGGPA